MNDEPPSRSAESGIRLSMRKKIKDKIKEVYQNFSYKPQNKQELAGSIRDSSERGVLEKGTLNMIEGALRVSTDKVRDIMIPKPQMVYVDSEENPEDFLPRVAESSHSRFPVINTELDKIEGILLAKDLLPFFSSGNIEDFELSKNIRPAILIPESKKLNILLDELRAGRNHMAIVLDEYGGITGLVTIEDVLEEIVGEIEDEHDAETLIDKKLDEKTFLFSARTEVDTINKKYNLNLPTSEEYETLAGLLLHFYEDIPDLEAMVKIDKFNFVVKEVNDRSIQLIQIHII